LSQRQDKPQQFSLATLLLVTALVAVCLALFRAAPLLGAIYLLLGVPAFIRTLLLAQREKRYGGRLTAAEKVAVFLGSLAVVLLVVLGAAVAGWLVFLGGLVTAMAARSLGEGPVLGLVVLGTMAALTVGILTAWHMFRISWPSREAFVEQLHRGDFVQLDDKRHSGEHSA
jgi:hypothetical protein